MRRKDREIKDQQEMIRIMEQCEVCRVAFHDEDYPYILPFNFGMQVSDGKITLYFHGALEGKKYDLIRKNPRVGFEMDRGHKLVTNEKTGNCTMAYESVVGKGIMEIVPETEKYDALCILMKHYGREGFVFNQAAMPATTIFKLTVEEITGKANRKS